MSTIPSRQDAFGRALLDHLEGRPLAPLTLETDGGWSTPAMPPGWFFEPASSWSEWEREALMGAVGPVLDLGAGAGRSSLFLQELGYDVTAVDSSPGAVDVCRRRGIRDARLEDFLETLPDTRHWQTVLLLCGNLGLAGSWDATRDLLMRLHAVCARGASLVADTVDPTIGADARAAEYQRRKAAAGEYLGDVTLRLAYGDIVSPWWRQTNLLIPDVPRLVAGTGWRIDDHFVTGMDHYLRLRRDD